ncbi:hypothetical protein B296_00001808 [Ensete ventricosum]|uniref:Uncharacterized protein n=1 Tax=Ensete ventricosum TaxID=4639 RepID=A0A427B3Y5_ENSVE|nr:hypothetical protein B296_00001808 [Ensete ventricosum]
MTTREVERHQIAIFRLPFQRRDSWGGAIGEAEIIEEREQVDIGSNDERSAPRVVSGTVQGNEEVDGEESKSVDEGLATGGTTSDDEDLVGTFSKLSIGELDAQLAEGEGEIGDDDDSEEEGKGGEGGGRRE